MGNSQCAAQSIECTEHKASSYMYMCSLCIWTDQLWEIVWVDVYYYKVQCK